MSRKQNNFEIKIVCEVVERHTDNFDFVSGYSYLTELPADVDIKISPLHQFSIGELNKIGCKKYEVNISIKGSMPEIANKLVQLLYHLDVKLNDQEAIVFNNKITPKIVETITSKKDPLYQTLLFFIKETLENNGVYAPLLKYFEDSIKDLKYEDIARVI